MSELKNLTFSVQEKVQPGPFEALERRGVRRRRRRQTAIGAGAAVLTAAAIAAIALPLNNVTGTPKPPVATVPTTAAQTSDRAAEQVLRGKDRYLSGYARTGAKTWGAAWNGCPGDTCSNTAVLVRDGLRVTAPVRSAEYRIVTNGSEPLAVTGFVDGDTLTAKDPAWKDAVIVRVSEGRRVVTPLKYAGPTASFGPDEILTDDLAFDGVLVLNPRKGTLRKLTVAGGTGLHPVRDGAGRWWMLRQQDSRTDLAWTDDGKTWQTKQVESDPVNAAGGLAVSPDGRTVLVTIIGDGASDYQPIAGLYLSSNRAATVAKVPVEVHGQFGSAVARDDGSALLVGESAAGGGLFRITAAGDQKLPYPVARFREFGAVGGQLYGVPNDPASSIPARTVALSSDGGESWTQSEPR